MKAKNRDIIGYVVVVIVVSVVVAVMTVTTDVPQVHKVNGGDVVKVVDKGQEVPEENWPEILSDQYEIVWVAPAWMRE